MSVFSLLERLTPHIEREVNLIINSNQEAETLSSKLKKIQEGLEDAERQGITDRNIKRWLKELEQVMYQMDDILDEWTMNLRLEIQHSQYEDIFDPCKKVRSVLLSLCLCSCFKHVVRRREITLEMKALSQRLERILEERDRYNFVSYKNENSREFKLQKESTSFVDKSEVYGRDFEKDSLVKMLLSNGDKNGTRVISVVGIGGVGKTTLAQLAYNDPRVKDHFDLKAWVSVPDVFDASKIAKAILENVRNGSSGSSMLETSGKEDVLSCSSGASMTEILGQNDVQYNSLIGTSMLEALGQKYVVNVLSDATTLESLGQRMKAIVSKKSFLLVLDNIRTEDRNKWESLKNCLVGVLECRILVTTRSEIAARMMGTTHWQHLSLLSDADCGRIMNRIALDGRNKEESEKFRDIGSEIAKKCNGLPLAATTIGSMLALRFTIQEWQAVVESPLWKYEDEMGDIFRVLRLSYIELSPILKRCFLSCVLYPKGSRLHVAKLIRIWMAQGYISSSETVDQAQLKGKQYFQNLSMRSFFHELERYEHIEGNLSCKMHDIMHDFANYLSRDEYYFKLDGRTDELNSFSNYLSHYLPLDSIRRIRTFSVRCVPIQNFPLNLFSLLKCVRVLCLSDCHVEELPEEIGELIHLRFLDLSWNLIEELPETVYDLYNLQIMDLQSCFNLHMLPHGLDKLIKLRHLLISSTHRLMQFPQGLEKLTNLWTLDEFRATRDSVKYLRNLNQLQGCLCIKFERLDDVAEAEKANLRNKNQIQALELIFYEDVTIDVVEAMQPPSQIQTLKFVWGFNRLPSWITTSLNNLKQLTINSFSSYLPPLGLLPLLETLSVSDLEFESATLDFFGIHKGATLGGFPKLKELAFANCEWWEKWEDIEKDAQEMCVEVMPCLQKLEILRCPHLKALPHNLIRFHAISLQNLTITDCYSLEYRYHQQFGSFRDRISHIPYISIFPRRTDEFL